MAIEGGRAPGWCGIWNQSTSSALSKGCSPWDVTWSLRAAPSCSVSECLALALGFRLSDSPRPWGKRQRRGRSPCCHPQCTQNPRWIPWESEGKSHFSPWSKGKRLWTQSCVSTRGGRAGPSFWVGEGNTQNPRRPREVKGIVQDLKGD